MNQLTAKGSTTSLTLSKPKRNITNSRHLQRMESYPITGLVGHSVTEEEVFKGIKILDVVYQVKTSKEKTLVLYNMMLDKNWTLEQFRQALNNVLETNKFPTWTPADWFSVELPKAYSRTWYLKQLNESQEINRLVNCYLVDGVEVYIYKQDINNLPDNYKVLWIGE